MIMPLVYRRVDMLLSSNAGGEVREGDCLLIDPARRPEEGALTLVKRGRLEVLCRWHGGRVDDVLGLVIGVKRRL
jgi:hypothetical protein